MAIEQAPDAVQRLLGISHESATILRRIGFISAVAAVGLSLLATRQGWVHYRPGGAAFDLEIRPVVATVLLLSLVLAVRWEVVGAVLATLCAAVIVAFAARQLVPTHAAIIFVMFAIPALLWLVVGLNELTSRHAFVALGFTVAAGAVGLLAGNYVYNQVWGPTHPESTVERLEDSELNWVWSGAVTGRSASVRAQASGPFDQVRLLLSTDEELTGGDWFEAIDTREPVLGFQLDDLTPGQQYFYAIEIDGRLDLVRAGRFRTFPEGPASFSIAVGSCARVGSNGQVFDTIRELDPLLYLIAGDFHYGDNGKNDIQRYREVMDLTLEEPAQAALYRSIPVAYMWDDHDYGGNDSDGSSPSRQAAMAAYREYVPSYGLSGDESAIYQAFSIGRVRVILTDARSARNLDNDVDTDFNSMLGTEQKTWFKEELKSAAESHALVIWLNPVPWITDMEAGADHWGGYAKERQELANFIVANEIDNLLMVSGDAHMVAIDDGTNSNYSTDPDADAFPVFHSAALDRPGSIKGGPYSEGAFDGAGQFGVIDLVDDGKTIDVTLRAMNWESTTLIEYEFSVEAG